MQWEFDAHESYWTNIEGKPADDWYQVFQITVIESGQFRVKRYGHPNHDAPTLAAAKQYCHELRNKDELPTTPEDKFASDPRT